MIDKYTQVYFGQWSGGISFKNPKPAHQERLILCAFFQINRTSGRRHSPRRRWQSAEPFLQAAAGQAVRCQAFLLTAPPTPAAPIRFPRRTQGRQVRQRQTLIQRRTQPRPPRQRRTQPLRREPEPERFLMFTRILLPAQTIRSLTSSPAPRR